MEETVAILHPYSSFEYNEKYYRDESSLLYYLNAWPAIIADWSEKGLLPADSVTAEQFVWGAAIWEQMKDYQAKSAAMIADLEGQSLDADRQALLDRAKQYFEWFNFLDAYRMATAASS